MPRSPASRRAASASCPVTPGSARTVNAGSASRAAVAGRSPGITRWMAPIRGGNAVESTRRASPASQGPGPAPAVRLRSCNWR